jgi:hypothetical protein
MLKVMAATLLKELESSRLVVIKWPTENGYNRGSISQNPPWYQHLCKEYERSRKRWPKHRTTIKRHAVIRALKNIIAGKPIHLRYMELMEDVCRREIENR